MSMGTMEGTPYGRVWGGNELSNPCEIREKWSETDVEVGAPLVFAAEGSTPAKMVSPSTIPAATSPSAS